MTRATLPDTWKATSAVSEPSTEPLAITEVGRSTDAGVRSWTGIGFDSSELALTTRPQAVVSGKRQAIVKSARAAGRGAKDRRNPPVQPRFGGHNLRVFLKSDVVA